MSRPTQLGPISLFLLLTTSAISFVSGIIVWWVQTNRNLDAEPGTGLSIQPWLTIHGALNPLLCILFGFMWFHFRGGWLIRTNRVSGALMFGVFGGLILSGAGLYYSSGEVLREICKWSHLILGVAFPITLGWHAFAGWRRAKNGR